eukprot:CAMPEP_0175972276 /NCGR_PEP_ID=MMETSP0108-20121206/42133_1 /TAXON_ID=195067 ORGANISM="Goniomonas pacifica, Strain CCMP1869" /NCGR_SAMPLE_ID=MMETSP0108 /ASSEMBLY_ACC=CAM_ASM_000204 /LENGTH=77 /DNA_ID=CAMNT_0017301563 /DNA_START=87 /DNA_END=320 /DNA_ORIENTATION=-
MQRHQQPRVHFQAGVEAAFPLVAAADLSEATQTTPRQQEWLPRKNSQGVEGDEQQELGWRDLHRQRGGLPRRLAGAK